MKKLQVTLHYSLVGNRDKPENSTFISTPVFRLHSPGSSGKVLLQIQNTCIFGNFKYHTDLNKLETFKFPFGLVWFWKLKLGKLS